MKYFVKTYGCQMNESDSERIAGFLEKQEYKSAPNMERADLIVVVACSVRQSAIDRIFGLKKKFKNLKAKKILTGCVLKSDKKKFQEFFDEVLTINEFLGKNYLELQPKYTNPIRQPADQAFVPIMTGCDNFCSYCVVPYVRGREISRSAREVIDEIKNLINPAERGKQRYKEITLLGQNVNSYLPDGKAGQCGFPQLLRKINKLPGNFQIKFLTSHPKDMSDELINTVAKCEKISKEIHLPVQSGDNEILKKMNRGYTAEKYLNLIQKIKAKIPEARITTDVIVGFPGETEKQFQNTVNLFKKVGFSMAYINKYSARVGTTAARFKDNVPLSEKKRRWRILEKLVNERPKLIVMLGPTASGKSDLAIQIAKKYSGETISADSRQIYKGMDIGTGKIMKKEMQGIPHYCLNIANPKKQFTIAEYKEKALEAIDKIYKKGKIPILCGGTGFYIQAVVENLDIPEVKPDWKLRKELEKKSTEELFEQLKNLDLNRAQNIDAKNKRRLIRAIEIVLKTGRPVPLLQFSAQGRPASGWNVLYVGIKKSPQELKKLIDKRVDKMIKTGLEKEVKNLIKKYGWTMVLKNTIGYAEWKDLQNKKEIIEAIKLHTFQYSKRQMTWFSARGGSALGGNKYPGKKINWVKTPVQTEKLVKEFLS